MRDTVGPVTAHYGLGKHSLFPVGTQRGQEAQKSTAGRDSSAPGRFVPQGRVRRRRPRRGRTWAGPAAVRVRGHWPGRQKPSRACEESGNVIQAWTCSRLLNSLRLGTPAKLGRGCGNAPQSPSVDGDLKPVTWGHPPSVLFAASRGYHEGHLKHPTTKTTEWLSKWQ